MDIFLAQTATKLRNILQNIDQSEYLLPKRDKFTLYLKQLLAKSILTRCFSLVPVPDTLHYCIKWEHDYIAFAEYYNEPNGRSFGNCDIYNTTITWLRKHDHMARYFPIFLVFGAKFQYFDNGE